MRIILTDPARPRLFPQEPRPNAIRAVTAGSFERHLNEHAPLHDLPGHAPFCRLHVHRNWTSTFRLAVPITDANRHLLRPGYEARNRAVLPVLVRWFEGVAEGGSGVALEAVPYRRGVDYWNAHANWR